MQLSKRAKKIIAIVLVFLAINLAVDFVITKIVYDSILSVMRTAMPSL